MIEKEYYFKIMARTLFDSWNGYCRVSKIILRIHCNTFKNIFWLTVSLV